MVIEFLNRIFSTEAHVTILVREKQQRSISEGDIYELRTFRSSDRFLGDDDPTYEILRSPIIQIIEAIWDIRFSGFLRDFKDGQAIFDVSNSLP